MTEKSDCCNLNSIQIPSCCSALTSFPRPILGLQQQRRSPEIQIASLSFAEIVNTVFDCCNTWAGPLLGPIDFNLSIIFWAASRFASFFDPPPPDSLSCVLIIKIITIIISTILIGEVARPPHHHHHHQEQNRHHLSLPTQHKMEKFLWWGCPPTAPASPPPLTEWTPTERKHFGEKTLGGSKEEKKLVETQRVS